MKHTPGPWYPTEYAGYWELNDGPYYENAQLLNAEDYPNAEANATLAAAAPELLEALQMLYADANTDRYNMRLGTMATVESAIKKATS
jgi:hypothetical protein